MIFNDIVKIYENKKKTHGDDAFRHISEVFEEAKEQHKKDFDGEDHEQSWKTFKGHNLEKLIIYIIKDEVESMGLKIVAGDTLERTKPENLSEELSKVKRAASINYGEFGLHLPDADVIIYNPETFKIIAILSSKSTLRERVAQTGYWKIKLSSDPVTEKIRVFFITLDEDGTLTRKSPIQKGRAIAEVDTDGSYVMSETQIEESEKVKMFDKFIEDLKNIIHENN